MENGPRYRYAAVIHARRSVCECGHAFTLKKKHVLLLAVL